MSGKSSVRSPGGEAKLNEIRDAARELAVSLDAQNAFQELVRLIGTLLGTRNAKLETPVALARARGEPIDTACVDRLDLLLGDLRAHAHARRSEPGAKTQL